MIGNRIKFARRARFKSQQWLAEEIGVHQTSVTQWETGKTDPTTENLSRIAIALNASFEWLAKGVGEMDSPDRPSELKEPPAGYNLQTAEQRELLALFDRLSKSKREVLMNFVRDWIEK